MKYILNKAIFTLIFFYNDYAFCQIPTELNHLSNVIAKRFAAKGEIDFDYFEQNHISSVKLNDLFRNRNEDLVIRSIWDIKIPKQGSSESINKYKSQLFGYFDALKNKNLKIKKDYLLKIHSDSTLLWMSFIENFLFQSNQNSEEYLFTDNFTINGIIGQKLYLSSTFSMFRHIGSEIVIPDVYKGEWTKYFDKINTTFWYKNYTSLYLVGKIFEFEISNRPFSWGWSSGNSPLISANATPFNRFSLLKKSKKFNFEYFHGSLNDKSINEIHTDNKKLEKFIAGHRIQYKPINNFKLSISELVVYGNRSIELAYLNPISFFWAQEHNLGDLDNVLLAFDLGYRILPGLIFYNTLVIDELSWEKIFSNWWGNKYSYQVGLFLSFKNLKLPDFRFEFTAVRPWTYTHPNFSYNHRDYNIGAYHGPSSISYRLESFFIPRSNLVMKFIFEHIKKGIGLGSNINDNYYLRDKNKDWNTNFLLDHHFSTNHLEMNIDYYVTNMIKLKSRFIAKNRRDSLEHNYINDESMILEFIIGADIIW